MSIADKFEVIADAVYDKGVSDGKQSQYDEFWDNMQDNGNRTDYNSAFGSRGWNQSNFKPKYSLRIGACNAMFYQFNYDTRYPVVDLVELLERAGVTMTFEDKVVTYYRCFASARISRVGVIDVSKATQQGQLPGLFNTKHLKTIDKLIVCEANTLSGSFTDASALEDIEIEGILGNDINFQWSTLLTKESITSIVTHLSATATGQTLTLSKQAIKNAYGIDVTTDTDIPIDNEFYNLRYSKSNWTFAYAKGGLNI